MLYHTDPGYVYLPTETQMSRGKKKWTKGHFGHQVWLFCPCTSVTAKKNSKCYFSHHDWLLCTLTRVIDVTKMYQNAILVTVTGYSGWQNSSHSFKADRQQKTWVAKKWWWTEKKLLREKTTGCSVRLYLGNDASSFTD